MGIKEAIVTPSIAPPWLLGTVGSAKLKATGTTIDQIARVESDAPGKAAQSAYAHMAMKCDPSCLPYIGDDLLLPQGVNESVASYRSRLRIARKILNLYGTPWGVLRASLGCILPLAPKIQIVTNSSIWETFEAGADVTQPPWTWLINSAPVPFWNWDGTGYQDPSPSGVPPWWRFWVIIWRANGPAWCTQAGTWGSSGKKWGDPTKCWGFQQPAAMFRQIQAMVRQWKSQHSWCRWIIVNFLGSTFDPRQVQGGGVNPDGTWGRWSKVVVGANGAKQYVQSRFTTANYMDCPV